MLRTKFKQFNIYTRIHIREENYCYICVNPVECVYCNYEEGRGSEEESRKNVHLPFIIEQSKHLIKCKYLIDVLFHIRVNNILPDKVSFYHVYFCY